MCPCFLSPIRDQGSAKCARGLVQRMDVRALSGTGCPYVRGVSIIHFLLALLYSQLADLTLLSTPAPPSAPCFYDTDGKHSRSIAAYVTMCDTFEAEKHHMCGNTDLRKGHKGARGRAARAYLWSRLLSLCPRPSGVRALYITRSTDHRSQSLVAKSRPSSGTWARTCQHLPAPTHCSLPSLLRPRTSQPFAVARTPHHSSLHARTPLHSRQAFCTWH